MLNCKRSCTSLQAILKIQVVGIFLWGIRIQNVCVTVLKSFLNTLTLPGSFYPRRYRMKKKLAFYSMLEGPMLVLSGSGGLEKLKLSSWVITKITPAWKPYSTASEAFSGVHTAFLTSIWPEMLWTREAGPSLKVILLHLFHPCLLQQAGVITCASLLTRVYLEKDGIFISRGI